VPREILDFCPAGARIINTAPLDLEAIIAECKAASDAGLDVARLHSGDVSVWSAMGEQIQRLKAAGIAVSVTPGVPSFAAAAAVLEAELTLPGVAQSVVLTRTTGRASAMPETETLENFARTGATLAIHLSIHNLRHVIDSLVPFYGSDCPVAIVYRATWPEQQIRRGTLETIASQMSEEIDRTALILVGPALGNTAFDESRLYAADYSRRYRPLFAREGDKE
jgi:precorrin-4/cobalt-precorrin-4 C11-methyltransferase